MKSRLAAVFVGAALAPALALAGVPSAANSTIPSHVLLVGMTAGVPDAAMGEFVVIVRDATNTPEPDRLVEVRFLNCPGARVASDQAQAEVSARCDTHGITAMNDNEGSVRMTAVGGGDPAAGHGMGGCAGVYAGGVLLGFVSVAYLDEDGSGGLGGGDLAVWLGDFVTGDPIGRSDFDGDGQLSGGDLSLWLTAFSSGRQYHSAALYCP